MASSQYVALLRGINVGGRNKVPMAELRATFEDAGHTDVRTYIQSGNVVFRSTEPRASLEVAVERMLERHLGFPLVVVVRSHAQLRSVVANAPAKFGAKPTTFHSDAIFLRAPLTAESGDEDRAAPRRRRPGLGREGCRVLRPAERARTKSRMSSIVARPSTPT